MSEGDVPQTGIKWASEKLSDGLHTILLILQMQTLQIG